MLWNGLKKFEFYFECNEKFLGSLIWLDDLICILKRICLVVLWEMDCRGVSGEVRRFVSRWLFFGRRMMDGGLDYSGSSKEEKWIDKG